MRPSLFFRCKKNTWKTLHWYMKDCAYTGVPSERSGRGSPSISACLKWCSSLCETVLITALSLWAQTLTGNDVCDGEARFSPASHQDSLEWLSLCLGGRCDKQLPVFVMDQSWKWFFVRMRNYKNFWVGGSMS